MPSKVKRPVSINGIEFDALITEDRTLEASVPEYSVEDGYSVSDSIIIGTEKLSMTLFVTNTPVTWYRRHGSSNTRVKNVCARLEQMFFEATPVTIITNEKVYRNMAIESIGFSKNLETGYSREIPISFKKIRVTTAKTTTIPASYGKSGSSGSSAGNASTSTGSSGNGSSGNGSNNSSNSSKGSILYNVASSAGLLN